MTARFINVFSGIGSAHISIAPVLYSPVTLKIEHSPVNPMMHHDIAAPKCRDQEWYWICIFYVEYSFYNTK